MQTCGTFARAVLCAGLGLAAGVTAGHAVAQTVVVAAPDTPAAAGLSYADFLALAFPGAHLQDKAVVLPGPVTLRHLLEDGQTTVDDPDPVNLVQAVPVTLGGQACLALLAALGPSDDTPGQVTVLALFGLAPSPALLDVVEVDTDQLTGFGDPATVSTGPKDAILIIDNSHSDAGQFYHQETLVALAGPDLQPIDTVSMLDLLACNWRLEQRLAVLPDTKAPPPWPLRARVTETVAADGACSGDPQPMPKPRSYAVTYARQPSAWPYRRTQGTWSRLDSVNASRS